jgi:hypothetical protein
MDHDDVFENAIRPSGLAKFPSAHRRMGAVQEKLLCPDQAAIVNRQ